MDDKITSKSFSKIKDFISNASFLNRRNEICGFLGFDPKTNCFIASIETNQSDNPHDFFSINPISYLQFKNSYSLLGVFHSHVVGDENPSEFDIKMSEASCLPFIVFSINTKNFYIYEPLSKDYDVNIFEKVKAKLT